MSMMFDALVLDADGTNAALSTGSAGVGGNIAAAATINGPWRDISGVDEGEYGLTIPPQTVAGALQVTLQFADDIVTPTVKETATFPLLGTGGQAVPTTGDVLWLRWGHQRRYMRSVMVSTGGSVSFLGIMAGLCSGSHELSRAG